MNEKKSNFKEYVYPVIILTVICLVTTLLLAVTNSVTAPVIAANTEATQNAAREALLSDADSFEQVEITDGDYAASSDGKAVVQEVYQGSKGGDAVGYVMTVSTKSFGGDLIMMVGVDSTGAVTGIQIISHSDTSGVGTKNFTDDYLGQYVGMTEIQDENVKKDPQMTGKYITGASVTGTALHKGVYAALAEYAALEGGAN